MPKVTRLAVCASLAALLLSATVAFAGPKPHPTRVPIGASPAITSVKLGPATAQSTCTLGVTEPAAYIIDYIYPPQDAYYTLIDPATCTACGSGPVTALAAHVYLNFRAACAQPITVGIYGVTGDATCYTPDPGNVLCGPFTATLTPLAAGNYNFSVALPTGCCITGPAFLKIEFGNFDASCATSTTWPRLITTADCSMSCNSWNIYPGGGPDDLCVDIGFPGYPVMNLDVDCCNATPTLKHSWGSLKSTYR